MRLFFIQGGSRLKRDTDGNWYTDSNFNYDVWDRYKVLCDELKVALATCHDKRNFGSMLQAYATQAYLEAQGYGVRTIDKTGLGKVIKPGRMDYYRRNALDGQMYREKSALCWQDCAAKRRRCSG